MARQLVLISLVFMCICSFPYTAYPAPLLDDVPADHWAHDAVANIASRGLLEGYPDGMFKGDRAATRNEMAMVVARLLAKNDQEHATFATKANIEEFMKLSGMLKSELEAQGVQATGLEENLRRLKLRVNGK